jgi:hypothetical protein
MHRKQRVFTLPGVLMIGIYIQIRLARARQDG